MVEGAHGQRASRFVMWISTRRFFCRSSSVSLDATGRAAPKPAASRRWRSIPCFTSHVTTLFARRWLGAQSPLPSLFFVRTDGTIASVHRGYSQDGALVLAEEIEKVLGVKVSPPTVAAPPPEPVDAGVPAAEPTPKGKKPAKTPKKKKK